MEQNHESEDKLERKLGVFIVRDKIISNHFQTAEGEVKVSENQFFLVSQDGWTAGCTKEVFEKAIRGKMIFRESYKDYTTGWLVDGKWVNRRTDDEIREHEKLEAEQSYAVKKKFYDTHRAYWEELEAALPEWLKEQVDSYRQEAAEDTSYSGDFDLDYWGFSVVVATLAWLYYGIGDDLIEHNYETLPESMEPRELKEFAAKEGTTETQHKMAVLIARRRLIKEQEERNAKERTENDEEL